MAPELTLWRLLFFAMKQFEVEPRGLLTVGAHPARGQLFPAKFNESQGLPGRRGQIRVAGTNRYL